MSLSCEGERFIPELRNSMTSVVAFADAELVCTYLCYLFAIASAHVYTLTTFTAGAKLEQYILWYTCLKLSAKAGWQPMATAYSFRAGS